MKVPGAAAVLAWAGAAAVESARVVFGDSEAASAVKAIDADKSFVFIGYPL
jgi:hypothetical protein